MRTLPEGEDNAGLPHTHREMFKSTDRESVKYLKNVRALQVSLEGDHLRIGGKIVTEERVAASQ